MLNNDRAISMLPRWEQAEYYTLLRRRAELYTLEFFTGVNQLDKIIADIETKAQSVFAEQTRT